MSKGYKQVISEKEDNKQIERCSTSLIDSKRKRMELLKLRNLEEEPLRAETHTSEKGY